MPKTSGEEWHWLRSAGRPENASELKVIILISLSPSNLIGVLIVNDNEQFLGMVKEGKLEIIIPEAQTEKTVKLTEMPIQAAIPPKAQEIIRKRHEGKAIMVKGHYNRDWIYSAEIIDVAGPIQNALVQKAFGKFEK